MQLFLNISGTIFLVLHERPRLLPWIKSISSELDITNHMMASRLSGYCDVINNRLWRHQQNINLASEPRGRCVKIVVLIVILSSLCRVRNKIMHVLSWRTVSALTRVLILCSFPPLHQNNPLVRAETVRHSSTYINTLPSCCTIVLCEFPNLDVNTLWPRQMAAIIQTTFLNAFSWIKIFKFRWKFH